MGKTYPVSTLDASECSAYRLTKAARENAGTVIACWHLTRTAKRNEIHVGTGDPVHRLRYYFQDSGMALASAKAELARRQRGKFEIAITCPGDPTLSAECTLKLTNFRPGVSGDWLITTVTHHMGSEGYSCDVEAQARSNTQT